MNEFYIKYFNAERRQSVAFIVIGIIAVLLAAMLAWRYWSNFIIGFSIPLCVFGIIFLAIGSAIFARSGADMERVKNWLTYDPAKINSDELPRMKKVKRRFFMIKWLEIFLLALGFAFVFFFELDSIGKGFGSGLIIMSAIAIVLDQIAEKRANVYYKTLERPVSQSVLPPKVEVK